jgi:hypothetical protein
MERRPPHLSALPGILAFAVIREATTTVRGPIPAVSRPASTPQKPAFTRAEEAYIQALWPIHGEVEPSTVRVSGPASHHRAVGGSLDEACSLEPRPPRLQAPRVPP